jgi:hypothetical protein
MQVKIKKGDTDLAIDQLREVFRVLAVDKVPTSKLEKRLDDLAHKWDEIKKVQPQVKSDVEPIQVGGVEDARQHTGCAGTTNHQTSYSLTPHSYCRSAQTSRL